MNLIDARTGIVRRVTKVSLPSDYPPALTLVEAVLADSTTWTDWPSDPSGTGCRFFDDEGAERAAIGEAIERYCGNVVPKLPRPLSYEDLHAAGRDAVDPESLALFSAEQYDAPGFPFRPFTRQLRVRWVAGRDTVTGGQVCVPASLVWVTYFRAEPSLAEPRTNPINYAGIAAGASAAQAELSGLLELVERDAVHAGHLLGQPVDELVAPSWLTRLAAGPTLSFQVRFLSFPAVVDLPVVGALLFDAARDHVALGTACHVRTVDAAVKALAEAFQLLLGVRQLDDPDSELCRIAATEASPLKPWRADRRYLDSYRADLRDATDLACNLQLWLDRRLHPTLDGLVTGSVRPMAESPGPEAAGTIPAEVLRRDVARALASRGIRTATVDVTTPDVYGSGVVVSRTIAVGLSGNSPAALPYLGGRPEPAAGNPVPLPYA
jgi:ribosomal protein S12 methylthiotransferase accessory factor